MTEDEELMHARLHKSFEAVKQACVQWFSAVADMSADLDSWSSLFEEYYCASLVDIETTPLRVHSDIDVLTMSKTNRHLMCMLDELKNRHDGLKEIVSLADKEWTAALSASRQCRNSVTVDRLSVATALRPSIAKQMAALEQLKQQLHIKYASKLFCLQRLYQADNLNRVHDLICVWKDSADLVAALQNVDLLSGCS